jgi:REP element-mobilizing transposase RayT
MESAGLPNRQSIRMKGWDYTSSGCYFVTINTHKSRALFGVIVNGRMVLNQAGQMAAEEWRKSAVFRKGIKLDEFVVMPNHVHGIVRLQGFGAPNPSAQFGRPVAGSLGAFVGAYKAAVSREIRRRGLVPQTLSTPIAAGASAIWHRNYWDVIIRDEKALAAIRNYIRYNPQNYAAVMNVGEPQWVGNRELLELPKTGFLASRGADVPHGRLPMKPGEAVISGFLSPMERAVFKAGLEQKRPLIWVKPWGLDEEGLVHQTRTALDEGRLLIVSPFADCVEAPSVRRAAWCNHYVLTHCDRMVVGHLNPGGMLACILSESDPELEILYL